jgi:hypothetical protein
VIPLVLEFISLNWSNLMGWSGEGLYPSDLSTCTGIEEFLTTLEHILLLFGGVGGAYLVRMV